MRKMNVEAQLVSNGGGKYPGYWQCYCGQKFVYTNFANYITAARSFNIHCSMCIELHS